MTDTALKRLLAEIIADNQNRPFLELLPRRVRIATIENKATVVLGVRRSGKTSLLHQLQRQLLDQGVDPKNIVEINFFDDRLQTLTAETLGLITEAYYEQFPEKKGEEKVYFFFDELQEIKGWERFVERLQRTEISEIYITGSSSAMLSKEIASQMGGRALSHELFPLSFAEYLDFQGIRFSDASSKTRLILQKEFRQYLQSGGFPEVQFQDRTTRRLIHQEYYKAIVNRDVVVRHDVRHPRAVNNLAHRLVSSSASLYTTNRLYQYLRSQSHRLSKDFVADCLEWFEDSYFLFSTYIRDQSLNRRQVNPRKIYCVDHGAIRSLIPPSHHDQGRLLETLVFVELRRRGLAPFYYKTDSNYEVDFAVDSLSGDLKLIQVALHLEDPKTRKRELRALLDAMAEQKLEKALLLTMDDQETIRESGRTIEVLPVWRFLLEQLI